MAPKERKALSEFFERVRFRGRPRANRNSVVISGHARFTVLTPQMIRLEWSETGEFEDRGTYAFPTRYAPTPRFTTQVEGQTLVIDTSALHLRYQEESGRFSAHNLSIILDLDGQRLTWTPGNPNPLNLRGTRRTLDMCEGDAALEEGLLSRGGWTLFDDSRSVLFDPRDGWIRPRPDHEIQDWVFFGYGRNYKKALADYTRFGGSIPLIPRYVLGAWWSRYWAYSDEALKKLVLDFQEHDLPLDVLVVDMDWHTPYSWTGYTWNRELFPDPPAFLQWVHDKGLRVTLNLHPAEGVQSFEEIYPRFAAAMGVDADSGQAIPFCISDRRFAKNYFELLHHPREDEGVDFWWVDWQQGETSEMKGLDPLLWLNHLHFHDSARRGLRPLLYSRWGGLGNHRYQTGFSGDTFVGWSALQFQPYFTATASNVAYGWWGHDIGGHMGGATEPELYARWVQYGALSPSLRLHATKDLRAERRPWKYPNEVYETAKAAFHLRYQLLPYIYTMARVAHDTGVSLCRPIYYEYPEEDGAYVARYQYFFGGQMVAAPIVHPADPETGMAATDVWIPPGTWIEYTTKETFRGPRWVRLVGELDHVPMLMKAGAILPLAAPFEAPSPAHLTSGTTDTLPQDRLVLSVFPGANGRFRLYQDDGITEAYRQGQYEWTEISTRLEDPSIWEVHIAAVEGTCDALPKQRGYELRLEGSRRPDRVLLDGQEISKWTYDAGALRTTIPIPKRDKRRSLTITAIAQRGISALGDDLNQQVVRSDVKHLLGTRCPDEEDWEALLNAVLHTEAPGRENAIARLGGPFVHCLEYSTPEEAGQQLGRVVVGAPAYNGKACDAKITFTLHRGDDLDRHTIQLTGLTESQIIATPFAFDGRVQAACWMAEVELAWRGKALVYSHHSQPLFPTIHAWQVVVYDRDKEPLTPERVVDRDGQLNQDLDWKRYAQTGEGLININQPHAVLLHKEYRQQLKEGVPLAAYMATTILSPDEREAVLRFRTAGTVAFWLNGRQVQVSDEEESDLHPLLRQARRTSVMHLRAGRNRLLVSTRPVEGNHFWFFGGALTMPDGALPTDLTFE